LNYDSYNLSQAFLTYTVRQEKLYKLFIKQKVLHTYIRQIRWKNIDDDTVEFSSYPGRLFRFAMTLNNLLNVICSI